MNKLYLILVSILASACFLVPVSQAFAEGSATLGANTQSYVPSDPKCAAGLATYHTDNSGGGFDGFVYSDNPPSTLSPVNERLYVHVKDFTKETIYMGFLANYDGNAYFRVMAPDGSVACGPFSMSISGFLNSPEGGIDNVSEAYAGPKQLVGGSGYDAAVCTPSMNGDYWIEINANDPNVKSDVGLDISLFDVTVYGEKCNGSNGIIDGRLYSYTWAFSNLGFANPFCGELFAYSTADSIVTAITALSDESAGLGFRPFRWTASFNATGTTNTGTAADDLQSVHAANSTGPLYPIFLNDPDVCVWESGTPGDILDIDINQECGLSDTEICFTSNRAGQFEIIIDLNGIDDYQPNSADVIFFVSVPTANTEYCQIWDGIDGLGNQVSSGKITIVTVGLAGGLAHFPVYDAEFNDLGFEVRTVRPAGIEDPEMLWDNRPLYTAGEAACGATCACQGTPSPQFDFVGCTDGCNKWSCSDFGNQNTINTFWRSIVDKKSTDDFNIDVVVNECCHSPNKDEQTLCDFPSSGVVIDVLSNDDDPENKIVPGTLAIGDAPPASAGTATVGPGSGEITFTPVANFQGSVEFTYTVEDNTGCEGEETVSLIIDGGVEFNGNLTVTDVSCNGGTNGKLFVKVKNTYPANTFTLTGPSNQTKVKNQNQHTFSNLPPGNYTIEVTDDSGCPGASQTFTVDEPAASLSATASKTDVESCALSNGTITVAVTGGTAPYSVSTAGQNKSTSGNTTFSGLGAGFYGVTVTDANGCDYSTSIELLGPFLNIEVQKIIVDATCGESDGSATITATGDPNGTSYNYAWDFGGQTGNTLNNVPAGIYTATITDPSTSCSTTEQVAIGETGGPVVLVSSIGEWNCNDGSGTINLNISTGTGPFSISWSGAGSGSTSQSSTGGFTIGAANPGTYEIEITDNGSASNCKDFVTVFVEQSKNDLSLSPVIDQAPTCDSQDGQITVTVNNGSPSYTYFLNGTPLNVNNSNSFVFSSLGAGMQTIKVVDSNGCIGEINVELNDDSASPVNPSAFEFTTLTCAGDFGKVEKTDGDFTDTYELYAIEGNLLATFSAGTPSFDLAPGTYVIKRTDGSGCESFFTFTIESLGELRYEVQLTDITCDAPFKNNGKIEVVDIGGLTCGNPSPFTMDNLTAGTYDVEVSYNCTAECSTSVEVTLEAEVCPPECYYETDKIVVDANCGKSDGLATIYVSGDPNGTNYNYSWSSGATSNVETGLAPGLYTVQVTDPSTNCSFTENVAVGSIGGPVVLTDVQNKLTCNSAATVELNITSGTGPFV
ncbi:MAG: Ig-like domain-containing protein, partial [Chitinophagales bacterium]